MTKAERAIASAWMLLGAEDTDGACNRAYYAIFDAARAVLLSFGYEESKTHRGVINAFCDRFVKDGPFPSEMGRLFNQVETRRCLADYKGDPMEVNEAREMVEQAEAFIAAIRAEFTKIDD
ncbi:MAG: HEPN domain-containing protein [Candidatus Accumulibacter sp.]|jgi:uncharacterized protein (UPF0332 family)|nr:HEPN domain-containing protein [Accumulibacter sp.]